ncbi:hypothetical protein Y1Q_0015531 [Alligator mississippiensis]|uniref:Uncharacterized protein n=1 Tax=Alligator mississippiensis TaxID=8496 RepID=A0A151NN34_ALLMI|nr:hypothetical protein Y1Q_0015531 [Alligator mississippiensis]
MCGQNDTDLRFQLKPCLGHCFACLCLIFPESLITYLKQKKNEALCSSPKKLLPRIGLQLLHFHYCCKGGWKRQRQEPVPLTSDHE